MLAPVQKSEGSKKAFGQAMQGSVQSCQQSAARTSLKPFYAQKEVVQRLNPKMEAARTAGKPAEIEKVEAEFASGACS